eukprot:scaffold123418_cov36-Phaeocystis_antarctica.AAC.1
MPPSSFLKATTSTGATATRAMISVTSCAYHLNKNGKQCGKPPASHRRLDTSPSVSWVACLPYWAARSDSARKHPP